MGQEEYVRRVTTLDAGFAEALHATAGLVDRTVVHFLIAAQRRALINGADWRGIDIGFRAQGEE